MQPVLSAAQMRAADRYTIDDLALPEIVLMEHAALAVAERIWTRFTSLLPTTRGVILVGAGNNGGDALAAARILHHRGCHHLFVVLLQSEDKLSPSASLQLRALARLGVPWNYELSSELLDACDWIIDGIFGTGLARPVEGKLRQSIESVAALGDRKWVVAVDIPSGLCADTGNPLPVAVRAVETVTLGHLKRGLLTGQAADFVGKLSVAPIQIPRDLPTINVDAFHYDWDDAARLPRRARAGHKGKYGHVYVVAGSEEKQGACLLTALAALRAGAGLVTLVGAKQTLDAIRPRLPIEIMTQAWDESLFEKTPNGVMALGPGMSKDKASASALEKALRSDWKLVLDADALNLIAAEPERFAKLLAQRAKQITVMTPHPKEASRLLQCDVGEVEADRYRSARRCAEQWHVHTILKGKGTLITQGGPIIVVTTGDSGLSKGGTGDVLTGVSASLLAQGLAPLQALPLACFVHGRASELLTRRYGQERSSLASEIADMLPLVFKEIEEWNAR